MRPSGLSLNIGWFPEIKDLKQIVRDRCKKPPSKYRNALRERPEANRKGGNRICRPRKMAALIVRRPVLNSAGFGDRYRPKTVRGRVSFGGRVMQQRRSGFALTAFVLLVGWVVSDNPFGKRSVSSLDSRDADRREIGPSCNDREPLTMQCDGPWCVKSRDVLQ
jgi:hypothetical protein